jgi:flagellar biosynthesis protein FlhG
MRPRKAVKLGHCARDTAAGAGKTNVTINVALPWRVGLRIGVLDADFGLGNVDVLLGLSRADVGTSSPAKTLFEIVVRGPHGISIIPASSGLQSTPRSPPCGADVAPTA